MSGPADHEPQPSPENVNHPPYMPVNELHRLGGLFTYDNFNIVTPPQGEPFLVATVPETGQSVVEQAFTRAREAAFKDIQGAGSIVANADLPEEEKEELQGAWSEMYLPWLKGMGAINFNLTLNLILHSAQSGAEINAINDISAIPDVQQRNMAMRDLERKEGLIDRFLNAQTRRLMFYNGNHLVFRNPPDLENPYNPASAGRQN